MPADPTPPPTLPERLRAAVGAVFTLDLRSLALLRALLGLLLIGDIGCRLGDLRVFYTDSGILPRSALTSPGLVAATDSLWRLDLHAANGTTAVLAALFVFELLVALALLFGWRSRAAAGLAFLLHASVLNRNPLIIDSGDVLLSCLLFWSTWLPIGARWSFDAALAQPEAAPPADPRWRSWSAAALLLQVLSVYFFGALIQADAGWTQGDAFAAVLKLDAYARPLGHWLRGFPDLERALGVSIHIIELCSPLLALLPIVTPFTRFAALLLLALVQVGAIVGMRLGIMPWANLAGLSVLIGSSVWDWLARRAEQPQPAPLRLYYDRNCDFCLKLALLLRTFLILPRAQLLPAQDNARADALLQANHSWVVIDHDEHAYLKWPALIVLLRRSPLFAPLGALLGRGWSLRPGNAFYDFLGKHRAGSETLAKRRLPFHARPFAVGVAADRAIAALMFLLLIWNVDTVATPSRYISRALAAPLQLLRLDQRWDWFARLPMQDNRWLVVAGEVADGSEVDLLRPQHPILSYDKPVDMTTSWPNLRWRNYFEHLIAADGAPYRPLYGHYLCRRWNAHNNGNHQLIALKLIDVLESPAAVDATAHVEQRVLWRQACISNDKTAPTDLLAPFEGEDETLN